MTEECAAIDLLAHGLPPIVIKQLLLVAYGKRVIRRTRGFKNILPFPDARRRSSQYALRLGRESQHMRSLISKRWPSRERCSKMTDGLHEWDRPHLTKGLFL